MEEARFAEEMSAWTVGFLVFWGSSILFSVGSAHQFVDDPERCEYEEMLIRAAQEDAWQQLRERPVGYRSCHHRTRRSVAAMAGAEAGKEVCERGETERARAFEHVCACDG